MQIKDRTNASGQYFREQMDLSDFSGSKTDPARDVALLGFFENYPVEKMFRVNDSFLLLGKSDHLWAYFACDNVNDLTTLMQTSRISTRYFASVEEWMIPVITENAEPEWCLSTIRYILPRSKEVGQPSVPALSLDITDAGYIYDHSEYRIFTSKEYIKERIGRGISAGINVDGRLVAWSLTHDDNSLGFLHVLPEFRRKGYGKEVSKSMIFKRRQENKPVYVNIEPANKGSADLVRSMGFVPDRKISWIKLKQETVFK